MLALALLELGLRIPEVVPSLDFARPEPFTILALGESTTQGGFTRDHQYPALLEDHLGQECPGLRFRVVNGGMAGARAADLLEALPGFLRSGKPRVALTMLGINDLLGHENPGMRVKEPPLRLLRLLAWLRESLRRPASLEGAEYYRRVSQPLLNAGDAKAAEARHRTTLAENPSHRQALLDLGQLLLFEKRPAEALEEFRRAEALGGDAQPLLGELEALGALGRSGDALAKAKALLARTDLSLAQVRRAWECLGQVGRREAMDAWVAASAVPARPLWERARAMDKEGPGRAWPRSLEQRYREIVAMLEEGGVAVFSFNYPRQSAAPVRGISPRLRVIDLEAPFHEAVAKEGYARIFYDSFGGNFGHLTARGNQLLAKLVGDALLAEEPLRSECRAPRS